MPETTVTETETEAESPTLCDHCDSESTHEYYGHNYCEECYSERYTTCVHCEGVVRLDDAIGVRDYDYCESCYIDLFFACDHCGEVYPRSQEVEHDSGIYCESCYSDHYQDQEQPLTLAGYTKNYSGILDYGAAPSAGWWTERHNPGSCDDLREFIGFELEVNHSTSYETTRCVHRALARNLPNSYLMTNDSSIGEGCEIIFCPHDYRELFKRNNGGLRRALEELKKIGVTSYKSGKCGLHVHIGRRKQKIVERIQAFFAANHEKVRAFSKRSQSALDRWAKIGGEGTGKKWKQDVTLIPYREGKYCSVHPHGSSLEFRCFRGTLDYSRVKASILFSVAIAEFAVQHSIATCGKDRSWGIFREWIRRSGRYSYLDQYLNNNPIITRSYIPVDETDDDNE